MAIPAMAAYLNNIPRRTAAKGTHPVQLKPVRLQHADEVPRPERGDLEGTGRGNRGAWRGTTSWKRAVRGQRRQDVLKDRHHRFELAADFGSAPLLLKKMLAQSVAFVGHDPALRISYGHLLAHAVALGAGLSLRGLHLRLELLILVEQRVVSRL